MNRGVVGFQLVNRKVSFGGVLVHVRSVISYRYCAKGVRTGGSYLQARSRVV